MLPGNAIVTGRRRVATAFVFFTFLIVIAESKNSQVRCSKTCVAKNCNSVGIRYGKYCGVGWTGCPGEKPCDDLDACCKIHDECVEKNGSQTLGFLSDHERSPGTVFILIPSFYSHH